MSYPANARTPVQDRYWIQGCNTLPIPTDLGAGYYYWAENAVNRGGVLQTRPGRNLLFELPGTRAQGAALYRPYRQREQLVWAIDGKIYYSSYPFGPNSYRQIPNIQFYKDAPQVFFCQSRQVVQQNMDGSLTLLPAPIDVLMMQDGYTASAFYIATSSTAPQQSGHNKASPPWYQCPVGGPMFYSGNRLWVAYEETIFASDLGNPNSFTERTYLAESDGFQLPEPCTGMLETPSDPTSTGAPALLCFTPFTITSLQSSILDRTQWQNTPNFQVIVSKDYGNVSTRAPVNQFGLPWFFSEIGFMNINEALNQYRTSIVSARDTEMQRSKMNMSPDRTGICTVSFENWLLVAVPSGSRWNRHTWLLDGAPQAQMQNQAGPCWTGIWTGTMPVQFVSGEVQDTPRCFELSYSCNPTPANNHILIWEDFLGRRTDNNETPVECSWETKIFEVDQVGGLCRFKFAELDIVELIGVASMQIYYAGIKGHYRKIYEIELNAEEGMPGDPNYQIWSYNNDPDNDTTIQSFKSQVRTVRTPDYSGSPQEQDNCSDTCGIESDYQHNVDRGFQLLVNWQGRLGIRELRLFVEPYPQPGIGVCTPTEVGEINVVTAVGCLPVPKVCQIPVP